MFTECISCCLVHGHTVAGNNFSVKIDNESRQGTIQLAGVD